MRVGRVIFRPKGYLIWRAEKPGGGPRGAWVALVRREIRTRVETATAELPVEWPTRRGTHGRVAAARERIADSVAVLRLFQAVQHPEVNNRAITFGLGTETGIVLERHYVLDRRRLVSSGGRWAVLRVGYDFTEADLAAYKMDAPFAYLDRALKADAPSEFERRLLSAIRTYSLAISQPRDSLQVVLLATALEALLGDERNSSDPTRYERGGYLRIAQRASFLWCGWPSPRYPREPACFYLRVGSDTAMRNEIASRDRQGKPSMCSYFGSVYQLLADRNDALHRTRERYSQQAVERHYRTVQSVLMAAIVWAYTRAPRRVGPGQLDRVVARHVRSSPDRVLGHPAVNAPSGVDSPPDKPWRPGPRRAAGES